MKVRVWFSPQAREQALHAGEWWRANRPAAPSLCEDELESAVALLSEAPTIDMQYQRHPEILGLRRLLLSGTRYHVYYVHDQARAEIEIVAMWSAVRGRGPRLTRGR